MKRTWYRHSVYLALLALVILVGLPALAEQGQDITAQCRFTMRGGVTALEVAKDAFAQHRSANPKYQVKATGPYSPTRFGLYRSLVGADLRQDDFFENLDD
jgi:hypothetical protein